jgi:hypothetical protein
MLESNKNELDTLMNRYKEDLSGLAAKRQQEQEAQDKFISEFKRLQQEVIWPVIVDVGNQLNAYGHDYHVSEEDEYVDATAHFQPASITFNIFPATLDRSFYKPESTPYIQFIANRYAKKVGIVVSTMMPGTGGVVGAHGEYDPSEITKEFVEKEIVEVLKNTLIFHKEESK